MKFLGPIGIVVLIFSAYNSSPIKSSFKNSFLSHEKRVLNLYMETINNINTPIFPLSSFESNSKLYLEPIYEQRLQSDSNLQYFPATLWQVYALNGKRKWKDLAENYSTAIYKKSISGKIKNGEIIQNLYLTPFLVNGEKQYYTSLLKIVTAYISDHDKNKNTPLNSDDSIEKLLESKLLFFTSKETGDPVYFNLALFNAEKVFNFNFQNNKENNFFYGLENWNVTPNYSELIKLSTEDIYDLALSFHGFTIVNNELGIEKYHDLSLKLSEIFKTLFEDFRNDSANEQNSMIIEKIDPISMALICLALKNIESNDENNNEEISKYIFDLNLVSLEEASLHNKQYSFRMYYYMFEYLKQKNS